MGFDKRLYCADPAAWLPRVPQPWIAGMEAMMFTGWVYDHLMKYSPQVRVAHPAMLKAISAGKKKNDRVDAQKISDLLRYNYFPECYMASREIRDRRRVLNGIETCWSGKAFR
ncbi:MAG: hypothetical protein JO138_25430 [Acidobacteriaceae bacterium]|nr:hypothetical protein [Acidobacteriaceae bacterium]